MSTEGCGFESRSRQQSALWAKVEFSFRAVPYTKMISSNTVFAQTVFSEGTKTMLEEDPLYVVAMLTKYVRLQQSQR